MLAVSLGIYIIIMVFIWGFFLVAKVHFFKFREYSRYIYPVTKIIMLSLIFLTFLGAYFVYTLNSDNNKVETVEEAATNDVY